MGKLKEYEQVENQFKASAQARMDINTIVDWLRKEEDCEDGTGALLTVGSGSGDRAPLPTNQISIAAAASIFATIVSWVLFQLPLVSLFVALAVYVSALRSPIDSDDDDVAGAFARLVGRAAIQTVSISSKKAKTVARALVEGEEEIIKLRQKVEALEMEREELKRYKLKREFVDQNLSKFSLSSLQDYARLNDLPVGGTKLQLLMRLVEAEVIEIEQ